MRTKYSDFNRIHLIITILLFRPTKAMGVVFPMPIRRKQGHPCSTTPNVPMWRLPMKTRFSLFTDGACVKIIRTWTVIDWCQFNANTGFGKWTGLQVLKFNNTIDPVFTAHARIPWYVIIQKAVGLHGMISLPGTSDDCTADSLLKYEWKIDLNNNGTFDINGVYTLCKAPAS